MNFPAIVETATLTLVCFDTLVEEQHVTKLFIVPIAIWHLFNEFLNFRSLTTFRLVN